MQLLLWKGKACVGWLVLEVEMLLLGGIKKGRVTQHMWPGLGPMPSVFYELQVCVCVRLPDVRRG